MGFCLEHRLQDHKLQSSISNSASADSCRKKNKQKTILMESCVVSHRTDKVSCLFCQSNTGHCWTHSIIPDQVV